MKKFLAIIILATTALASTSAHAWIQDIRKQDGTVRLTGAHSILMFYTIRNHAGVIHGKNHLALAMTKTYTPKFCGYANKCKPITKIIGTIVCRKNQTACVVRAQKILTANDPSPLAPTPAFIRVFGMKLDPSNMSAMQRRVFGCFTLNGQPVCDIRRYTN